MANYVKNTDLVKEIIESKKNDKLTPAAVEMFVMIAEGISKKLKYKDPMDREDCIAGSIEDLLKYWRGFDPDRAISVGKIPNAFSYFTQIAKHGAGKSFKRLHHPEAGQMLSLSQNGFNL